LDLRRGSRHREGAGGRLGRRRRRRGGAAGAVAARGGRGRLLDDAHVAVVGGVVLRVGWHASIRAPTAPRLGKGTPPPPRHAAAGPRARWRAGEGGAACLPTPTWRSSAALFFAWAGMPRLWPHPPRAWERARPRRRVMRWRGVPRRCRTWSGEARRPVRDEGV